MSNKQAKNTRAIEAPVEFKLTPDSIEGWFDRLNQQMDEVERDIASLQMALGGKILNDLAELKRILKEGGI